MTRLLGIWRGFQPTSVHEPPTMQLTPKPLNVYHVFLASPGDVSAERQYVRKFFDDFNRQFAHIWRVRFEVVDWENYSTTGVGRPQELITRQTLEKFRPSLALVIGIMGRRFGSPSGKAESGTEEEFNWALESNRDSGFPEIKWFFRKVDALVGLPSDPAEAIKTQQQWEKVLRFRERMDDRENPVFYSEYRSPAQFAGVFARDLNQWLADTARPWATEPVAGVSAATPGYASVPSIVAPQAPPLPPQYVPRHDLVSSIAAILTARQTSKANILLITALHGTGGIGKTVLALAVAHSPEVQAAYPDGVYWASLGPEPEIAMQLNAWVRATGERGTDIWSDSSSRNFLVTSLHKKKALLVLDDVWNESDTRAFLVGGSRCHALVTTRRVSAVDDLGATIVDIPQMSSQESLALMQRRFGIATGGGELSPENRQHALALADELEHLPLAVDLAAGLVARRFGYAEARRQLISYEAKAAASAGGMSRPIKKIDTLLGLSLSVLREEDPIAWRACLHLALLPYQQRIHQHLLTTLWDLGEPEVRRICLALVEDALLRAEGPFYTMHILMHQMFQRFFSLPPEKGLGIPLAEGHAAFLDRHRACLTNKAWETLQDDGYIVERLVWHLDQAVLHEEIFDLLRTENGQGKNAWYVLRHSRGNFVGYLEDLRIAQEAAASQGNAAALVFTALCWSSVLGTTANYSADVVQALVTSGFWSARHALRWAQEACPESRSPECLLAIALAIRRRGDMKEDGATEDEVIARSALSRARAKLMQRFPTEAAATQLGRVLSALFPSELVPALRDAFQWCEARLPRSRIVGAMNVTIPREVLLELASEAKATGDPLEAIRLLGYLVPKAPETDRHLLCEAVITEISESLPLYWSSPKATVTASPLSLTHGLDEEREIPSRPEETAAPEIENPIVERWEWISAVQYVIAFFSHAQLLRLIGILDVVEHFADIESILESLRFYASLETKTKGDAADARAERELSLVDHALRGDADAVLRAAARAPLREVEALFSEIVLRGKGLPAQRLDDLAAQVLKVHTQSVAPQLIVGASKSFESDILDRLQLADRSHESKMAINCILFGSQAMAEKAVDAVSKIRDFSEQTEAMLSLVPYVSDRAGALLDTWRNVDEAGGQIAGLTEIIIAVADAIDAGALTEVVEAVSKQHSEWWVVEALSVAMLRVRRLVELEAIKACAPRIRNGDLRARLLGRLAIRLADLSFHEEAIAVACDIPRGPPRWHELSELGRRFASVGQLEQAVETAFRIESRIDRQGAFAHIALELGALGRVSEARHVVEDNIDDPEWRSLTQVIFLDHECDRGGYSSLPAQLRSAARAEGEGAVSESAVIEQALKFAREIVGPVDDLDAAVLAAHQADRAELLNCFQRLWRGGFDEINSLNARMRQLHRPDLLKLIAALAPAFALDSEQALPLEVAESVKSVSSWWP